MADQLLVATRKGLFTVSRRSGGWAVDDVAFLGDNCPIVMHDPRDDALYAGLSHGHFGNKMHRSDDGCTTWTEISTPAFPEMPEGYEPPVNPMTGKVIPWKLKLLWALEPGGADNVGRLWAGTIPGGLFRSDDRGETWTLNRPLWDDPRRNEWFGGGYDEPGIHSIAVDPRDADHVVVGVSCGGVWITQDAGASWTLGGKDMRAEYMPPERAFDPTIQDPHLIATCADHPDVMWVQHHNGLFRSSDAGVSWTELACETPSSFGFAVSAHPHDPNTAWFVPAVKDELRYPTDGKLVVTRTRDAGASFEVLTEGLPQDHAYDLVYRHAMDIDETGDTLAFGSTTGNLWLTSDGGDHWASISSHLPPIYAVRFIKRG
ncbi:MAG: exo-alpha-sialidase [Planctomycetota bacterium]